MNRILAIFAASVVPLGVHAAAVSSTQPAAGSEPTVLVLPVESPNGSYSWIGRAIQQDMLVDLTQMARARVLAPAGSPALDPDAALHSAREANANYVIFGSAQTSGAQLRVTGQVLDVTTGKSLSGLKATAPLDNLFPLEDALAVQVARALPTGVVREGALAGQPSSLPTIINGNPYVSEATPAPDYESVTAPDYTYGPDYYGYPYVYPPDYYYPGYGWGGLGWWGPGIVIGGRHHFGDHFGHFDHRNFISPHVNPGLHNRGFSGGHGFSHGSPGFGGTRGGAMGGSHFGGGGHVGEGGGHAGGGGGRGR